MIYVFAVMLLGLMFVLFFILGALFCRHIVIEAQERAQWERMRDEMYRNVGWRKPGDPRPYVPPRPITPNARGVIPGMSKLDRMLREGKRGTIMVRAGDRMKNAG